MSSCRAHSHVKPDNAEAKLKEYLANAKVKARLKQIEDGKVRFDESHDWPYLAGTFGKASNWGIGFDRHLPKTLKANGKSFAPREFLKWHEGLERALMDIYGLVYGKAHIFAIMLEHRKVKEADIEPAAYEKALRPYIKADEHERITKPDPSADLRPYTQDHDSSDNAKAVLRRMRMAEAA